MLYLFRKRLYNRRVGLLAAALGAAAVLPIQLSHYYGSRFIFYCICRRRVLFCDTGYPFQYSRRKTFSIELDLFWPVWPDRCLAGACKINTLPVFWRHSPGRHGQANNQLEETWFSRCFEIVLGGWALAFFVASLSFRVFQPYAFSGPGFLESDLNQDWVEGNSGSHRPGCG